MDRVIAILFGLVTFLTAEETALAAGGACSTLQARCAIEVGGQCNPNTGHWCYG